MPRCGCVCKPEPCFWGNFCRLLFALLTLPPPPPFPRLAGTAKQPATMGLALLLRLGSLSMCMYVPSRLLQHPPCSEM